MMKMNRSILVAGLGTVALSLSACAPGTVLAPAGPYAIGKGGAQTTLNRDWSDMSWALAGAKKARLLTIDGPELNQLIFSEGLVDGDFLVAPPQRKEATTPTYNSSMTVTEQIEFITDSLPPMGFERVQTSNVRPVTVNGQRGVRFDFSSVTKTGLRYLGRGQAVKANDKLYVAIYVAPEEHYFQATLASAEAAMDAVTF
jgi:hypothetical protein